MKRLLLLAVCALALFAAVPSHAACPPVSVDNGYLCVTSPPDSSPFEACSYGWTGNTTNTWTESCLDTNSDAWTDLYAGGYGEFHNYGVYLHNGYLQSYAEVGSACVHSEYDVTTSYYNAGTC